MNVKVFTRKDILKAFEQGKKEGIRLSLDAILSTVTLKLQDKHGMGKEELNRLESEVNADFEAVLADRITLDEIIEAKKEEIGNEKSEN